jgi:hypothetical protein
MKAISLRLLETDGMSLVSRLITTSGVETAYNCYCSYPSWQLHCSLVAAPIDRAGPTLLFNSWAYRSFY